MAAHGLSRACDPDAHAGSLRPVDVAWGVMRQRRPPSLVRRGRRWRSTASWECRLVRTGVESCLAAGLPGDRDAGRCFGEFVVGAARPGARTGRRGSRVVLQRGPHRPPGVPAGLRAAAAADSGGVPCADARRVDAGAESGVLDQCPSTGETAASRRSRRCDDGGADRGEPRWMLLDDAGSGPAPSQHLDQRSRPRRSRRGRGLGRPARSGSAPSAPTLGRSPRPRPGPGWPAASKTARTIVAFSAGCAP